MTQWDVIIVGAAQAGCAAAWDLAAAGRRDQGRQRHSAHFHAHQIAEVASGDANPGHSGGDPFQDKSVLERGFNSAWIDLRPLWHKSRTAQPFPIGLDLGNGGISNVCAKLCHVEDIVRGKVRFVHDMRLCL